MPWLVRRQPLFYFHQKNNWSWNNIHVSHWDWHHAKVWGLHFSQRLAIREQSRHSTCSVCVRHRSILKRLGNDSLGRQGQLKQYMIHLQRQYADRVAYWSARSVSRLYALPCGKKSLCMVTDGMDHSKYRFPRTQLASSKEFSGWIRPTLDFSAVIAHGHHVLAVATLPHVRKDASFVIDLLAHSLHLISEKEDLRSTEILIQSDNTSREVKNNVGARFGGMMVGTHRVRRLELRFLASGHSHEDIDQHFSAIGTWLESCPELATPADFIGALQEFHAQPGVRPYEPVKVCKLIGCSRAWKFDSIDIECFVVVSLAGWIGKTCFKPWHLLAQPLLFWTHSRI